MTRCYSKRRGRYWRRPGRCLRAGDHDRAQLVDGERRRPSAGRRRSQRWRHFEG